MARRLHAGWAVTSGRLASGRGRPTRFVPRAEQSSAPLAGKPTADCGRTIRASQHTGETRVLHDVSRALPLPRPHWQCKIRLHRWARYKDAEGDIQTFDGTWTTKCRDCGRRKRTWRDEYYWRGDGGG
jgi:hypothetical protein